MEELKTLVKRLLPEQRLGPSQGHSLPFTKALATAKMPPKFQMPRALPQSLEGDTHAWFSKLDQNSVDSWQTLIRLFVERHGVTISDEKDETELMEVRQKSGETIREYYQRFTKVAAAIPRVERSTLRETQALPLSGQGPR